MTVLKVEQIIFRDRQMLILSARNRKGNQRFWYDIYIDGVVIY